MRAEQKKKATKRLRYACKLSKKKILGRKTCMVAISDEGLETNFLLFRSRPCAGGLTQSQDDV